MFVYNILGDSLLNNGLVLKLPNQGKDPKEVVGNFECLVYYFANTSKGLIQEQISNNIGK